MKQRKNHKTLTCPNPDSEELDRFGIHDLHYIDWEPEGKERGTVICVHGLTRNARDFDYIACALVDQGYRVICPDIVGRGKSPNLIFPSWYGYPLYVSDMLALIHGLNLSQVHWVGTSMGGLIGMMLEAGTPHIIDKFVINDIGPLVPKESLMRIGSYVGRETEFETRTEAKENFRKIHSSFGIKKDEHWQHMFRNSIIEKDGKFHYAYDPAIGDAFWTKSGKQRPMPDMDFWPMFNSLNSNILVLRGKESDLLLKETADQMLKTEQVKKLVEFEDVGHAPMLMEDEQIQPVVDFLTK